jgi:hypothetical protein
VSRARAAVFALLAAAPVSRAADTLPAEHEARVRGPEVLATLLAHVEAEDPDVRVRARRLAKLVALDYYEAHAPEGMRLVPGPITVTPRCVRCERGFYLAVREVTLAEFREFAASRKLVDRWADGDAGLPVTNVSLEEARAYAEARGARLPTLEELTRAARGGGRLRYPWGQRFDPARVNSRESGLGKAEPAGSRAGGVSVHGIADLLGNVAEWTETPADKRMFFAAGGSYRGYARHAVLATYRLEPQARLVDVGFRLARTLPALPAAPPQGP